jgi:hypothetical protein
MDLIQACFVYVGLPAGSYLFLWWVLGEGVLGFALMGVGYRKRASPLRKLAVLVPRDMAAANRTRDMEGIV